jgi:hypothetical protein
MAAASLVRTRTSTCDPPDVTSTDDVLASDDRASQAPHQYQPERTPMKTVLTIVCGTAIVLAIAGGVPVSAQQSATRSVTLQVAGTAARGGDFSGTATINRFEERNNQIVAIGFVRGTVSRGSRTVGVGLIGEVVWPLTIRTGGSAAIKGQGLDATGIRRIAHPQDAEWTAGLVLAQAESCPAVEIVLGAIDVNVGGGTLSLGPIPLNLSGEAGTPVGDLVCAVSDLLGNVAGLVNLLNSILSLLTGLLGGLTGGLGGALP